MEGNTSATIRAEGVKEIGFHTLCKQLFRFAIGNNYAVAVWRSPSDGKIRLLIDTSGECVKVKADLEELGQGFIFSPFNNFDNSSAHFISGDIICTEDDQISFSNEIDYQKKARLQDELSAFLGSDEQSVDFYVSEESVLETMKEDFIDIIGKAVGSFQEGRFQKVVISRSKRVELNPTFDIIKAFLGLCAAYPYAFVSCVSIPNIGTWMGASPEVLISVDKQKIFKTAAVAGTQLRDASIAPAQVGWRQKDIEEQAMVSRYIINCFKKIRLREFDEIGPRTAVAGNLVHLKTDFAVDMQAVNFPQLGSVMLELLHPTSAICGMPRETAMAFIEKYEKYDRSFYSGFIGPVKVDGESHIYVNIRCMQLYRHHAVLYAGAGVTHESVPEKEWEETEIKMNTLLDQIVKMGFVKG
jgi:isochorismate synthase